MARIKLVEDYGPDTVDLVDRIKLQRRGSVLKLYKALLHSPPLAETWFEHLNAVRWKTQLEGRLRELVIIRIAWIHAVHYVIKQHIPRLAEAEGVTPDDWEALRHWPANAERFSEAERAALDYTEAMTLSTDVSDKTFAQLGPHFSERQIVDLTVLIATYNMHIRVIKALRIEPETS
jgi:alkylhydroperoxidase family enzyme